MEDNPIKTVGKVWGREEWLVNNDKYCGKLLYLDKGKRCSMHYHKDKDETFYILQGRVFMETHGNSKESRVMHPREVQHISPLVRHRFSGIEDSVIIEFSTHHEDADSYRIEDSGDVPDEIKKLFLSS